MYKNIVDKTTGTFCTIEVEEPAKISPPKEEKPKRTKKKPPQVQQPGEA